MTQTEGSGPLPADTDLDYYTTPAPMTALASVAESVFAGLPDEPSALCRVAQGVLIHEFWAGSYGVDLSDARCQEVRNRSAAQMVDTICRLQEATLATVRPPSRRMVGNCRHFSTFSTALLRRAGVPARARCGFATYFEPGQMVDHWVTEYYSAADGRWVRIDAQLDSVQLEALNVDFSPADMPSGPFLPAGEAWIACQEGQHDPDRFGILDMRGRWFIVSNVVRDLAALNKVELLPWDIWGPMSIHDPEPATAELIDRVAAIIVAGDTSAIRALYQDTESLQVPQTVFDARFGEPHQLDL